MEKYVTPSTFLFSSKKGDTKRSGIDDDDPAASRGRFASRSRRFGGR
jgi:hypothetical protein